MKLIPSKVEKCLINEDILRVVLEADQSVENFNIKSDFIHEPPRSLGVTGSIEEKLDILKTQIYDYCKYLPHKKLIIQCDVFERDLITILVFPVTSAA